VFRRRLGRLCERSPSLQAYIDASLERLNGTVGEPASFDSLAALLEAQAYRLAYWRVAGDEINYRRFFDINDLAALRVDDPEVFEATHAVILELVAAGQVDGLRIDHPDGLYDPAQYFERLQARFRDPGSSDGRPLYVVAEKILASHERLPADWAVHGTTGYDFMQLVNHWLLTAQAEEPMTRAYQAFTGRRWDFEQIVLDSKRQVMRGSLAAEVAVLTTQLDRIAQRDRHTSDLTRNGLRDAIIDTIACFPVYRTYVSSTALGDEDRHAVNWAINVARRIGQAADPSALEFLRAVLLGEAAPGLPEAQRVAMLEFAIKFQQVTAPVMAKGVEDTSFYIYNRLASLNEVGGDPRRFGLSTAALHRANADRLRHWPHAMLATSTHDTKRSEDARARGAALTQFAAPWRRHLGRWSRINRARRRVVDGRPAPSRNDEYLLYQTLLAAWPPGEDPRPDGLLERLVEYATKAAREAKVETSWVNPNPGYEQALASFLEQLLAAGPNNAFLRDLHALQRPLAYHGWLASLSQTLLKATSPGVPDFYQGNEIPTFRLVDPDNRAPVDFAQLARLHAAMRHDCEGEATLPAYVADLLRQWEDGRAKLYLTWRALQRRAADPALFAEGGYEALRVTGTHADHLCAFLRTQGERRLLVVASRDTSVLVDGALAPPLGPACWPDTRIELPGLDGAVLRDALAGRALQVEDDPEMPWIGAASLLATFPVALATCEVGPAPG
jgi:(1->4)-alpha-D-glucan 1-alpha-D-glucosylmutase